MQFYGLGCLGCFVGAHAFNRQNVCRANSIGVTPRYNWKQWVRKGLLRRRSALDSRLTIRVVKFSSLLFLGSELQSRREVGTYKVLSK